MFEKETLNVLREEYRANTSRFHTEDEFQYDLHKFLYVKRILSKYHTKKVVNVRLLLNHMIIIYNVFGNHATQTLKDYIDEPYLQPYLNSLLVFFHRVEEGIEYDEELIKTVHREIK